MRRQAFYAEKAAWQIIRKDDRRSGMAQSENFPSEYSPIAALRCISMKDQKGAE